MAGDKQAQNQPARQGDAVNLGNSATAAVIPLTDPGMPQFASPGQPASPTSESTIVEVQFRPGAIGTAAVLAGGLQGFLQGADLKAAESAVTANVRAVLLRRNLRTSSPSFSPRHLKADAERLAQAAAMGAAAPPDALAGRPQLQSFVRFEFASPEDAAGAARDLESLPEVEKVCHVPGAAPPNADLPVDPLMGTLGNSVEIDPNTQLERQWYLHRLGVPAAWQIGALGAGVVIADIDWGFHTSHRDLQKRLEMASAFNSVDGSRNVGQGASTLHGTGVLGIAGAAADGLGMVGIAPQAMLWPIQANTGEGHQPSSENWADAIEYVRLADSHGRRKVIILEAQTKAVCGNYEQIPSVNEAILRAIESNIVVCVAAGNGDRAADLTDVGGKPIVPTGSILVGATKWDPDPAINQRASFSNWGPRIVVSAPGDAEHDLTCAHTADDAYTNKFGGTSGAAPKVAGVAALMLSVNPTLSPADVREILRGTGTAITPETGPQPVQGKPIGVFLNAESAVREALRRPGSIARAAPAGISMQGLVHIEGLTRQLPPSQQPSALESFAADGAPASSPPADRTLREFRASTTGLMSFDDQLLAIDQAIQLLNLFYVHRPLKEAIHAVRPIQRLRVLQRQLEEDPNRWIVRNELQFHKLMTSVFMSVRDLHTNYLLPQPYRDYTAYLPFLVRPYYDDDARRRYIVTDLMPGYSFSNPNFARSVEILDWNGVAIEDAVGLNAQQTAGSNEAARFVRGVDALVLRPMNVALPPDADWVHVTFQTAGDVGGPPQEMSQNWLVRFTPLDAGGAVGSAWLPLSTGAGQAAAGTEAAPPAQPATRTIQNEVGFSMDAPGDGAGTLAAAFFVTENPSASAPEAATQRTNAVPKSDPLPKAYEAALGLDIASDAVREVKHLIFKPETVDIAAQRARQGSAEGPTLENEGIASKLPLVFQARELTFANPEFGGKKFAYVRIRTFAVTDPEEFVQEFIDLVKQLPQDGLILDVRGNGGGLIYAAERLLQTLTPRPIEPERMQFISTEGTLELCRRSAQGPVNLSSWLESLQQAVITGATYSQALPITDPKSCNTRGQCYQGPIVLLIDGRCYSATDIFAAGFQDHEIGQIVGSSEATGAGGANVWTHDLLYSLFSGEGSPLKPLPHKMGMRIAIRQTLRVGNRAGTLLEDFGVEPRADALHKITRRDLLENDVDMLAFAAAKINKQRVYQLSLVESRRQADNIQFKIKAQNISRIDFYFNGHPATSVEVPEVGDLPPFQVKLGTKVELRGYVPNTTTGEEQCVVAYKQQVA